MKNILLLLCIFFSVSHADLNISDTVDVPPVSDEFLTGMTIRDFADLVSQNDGVNIMVSDDVHASTSLYMFTRQDRLLPAFRLALGLHNYKLEYKNGFYVVVRDMKKELKSFKTYQLRSDIYQYIKPMLASVHHTYIPTLNRLVFRCSDEDFRLFVQVLHTLDTLRKSYNFKVTVFDLDSNLLRSKGFDTSIVTQYTGGNTSFFMDLLRVTQSKALPYLSGGQKFSFYSFVDYLNSKSAAKIEVSTIVNTLDNVSSKIDNVTRVPILKSTTEIKDTQTNNTNTYDYQDIGSVLQLKPHYIDDSTVYLDFDFRYSLLVDRIKSNEGSDYLPTYNQKSVNNIIRLKRGQAILVGGFSRVNQSVVNRSVPLLSDIPLLGDVFRGKKLSKSNVTTYIVIEYMGKNDSDFSVKKVHKHIKQFMHDEMLGLF
jgi:general secretion pathway protein D